MDTLTLTLFVVGIAVLIVGAEVLIRGASNLAGAMGISPLVVGLTVVAFGTSSPELAVTVQASFAGQADIAIGNVVGSNIANILIVMGLSALVVPLIVSHQLIQFDVPLMIGVSLLLLILGFDGTLSQFDGIILFCGIVAYTAWTIQQSRKNGKQAQTPEASTRPARQPALAWIVDILFIVIGLGMLTLGSDWLVDGAVVLAHMLGVSELIIGLTVVAIGTSLPEIATSVVGSFRGQRDIAVGNVIGSNIFNILMVLGVGSIVAPEGITVSQAALSFDIPVMIAVAVACLPILFINHKIARWEGALFVGYYIAYTLYLFLKATSHAALELFNIAMGMFVIPLTAVTLIVLAARYARKIYGTTALEK